MDKKGWKHLLFEALTAVVIGTAAIIWIRISKNTSQTGCIAVIISEGNETTVPLDKNATYTFTSNGGYNTVKVEDGEISVCDSDCPDKICMDQGSISKEGETIICLPHKLVIKIEGEGDTLVDSKTY